jgi:hypothetical protein
MANDLGEQVLRTSLGSYALYAYVASGGSGTVYFGRDLQSNRAVAIKRLHAHLAHQPALVERFEQEAQRLRGLQHPNIVQVLDDGKDSEGLPFIILQWVEGWTVSALLQQHGRFAIAEAVEIASQVLAALEAAGQRGVVHRDIKPANLMVTPPPDRQVKVMDFGIAKDLLANASGQYTQIGTIAYMAPEQFTQGRVDARTDVFALGITLYELLTGQRPSGALADESLTSLQELRPEVDPALAAVVYRALEKRPMDRFQTAAQMRAALEPFVGAAVDLTVPGVDTVVLDPAAFHDAEALATTASEAVAAQQRQEESDRQERQQRQEERDQQERQQRDEAARQEQLAALQAAHAQNPTGSDALTTVDELRSQQPVPRTSEPPPTRVAADAVRPHEAERRGWRRIGTPIWVGGVAALLAIGVVAQQAASRQSGQDGVATPAPVAQSTDVARAAAPTALPTDVPPTASPRAAIPPFVVPTSTTVSTSTPAPTPRSAPTAAPTVDDLWRAVLVQIDPTWSRDWPKTIGLLNAFLAAQPGFAPGQDKLYAARLFYADELLAAGDVDAALEQLDAANTLLPQRPEAKQTLVALTPTATATATTPPPVFVPPPQTKPAPPVQPRPTPPPLRP